jgi:hypothetical protein
VGLPASSSPDVSSEKDKAIRQLMEMIGAGDLGVQIRENLLSQVRPAYPQVPESLWTEIGETLDPAEFTAQVVPIYDQHFTMEELQALIDFYTTPVGQEIVKKLPIVAYESNVMGQQWGETKFREVIQRLAEQGYYRQQM